MVGDTPFGLSGSTGGYPTALSRVEGLEDDAFRPSNPVRRLEDMERDGVHASIVYGPAALFRFPINEVEHTRTPRCAPGTIGAAEEFNSHAPDRLSALPFLPSDSPEAAVEEFHRCAKLGHRGAILNPFEAAIEDPAWDRLWSAAAEARLPISFHVGGGTRVMPERDSWKIATFASVVPMQLDEPLAIMIFSGALERVPNFNLVLAECGVGWLPYFLARLDATYDKHSAPYPSYSNQDQAERDLRTADLRDLRGRTSGAGLFCHCFRPGIHVGVRLPPPGQHVAGITKGHCARPLEPSPGDGAPRDERQL